MDIFIEIGKLLSVPLVMLVLQVGDPRYDEEGVRAHGQDARFDYGQMIRFHVHMLITVVYIVLIMSTWWSLTIGLGFVFFFVKGTWLKTLDTLKRYRAYKRGEV